jgi:putative DNA primase/helicase
MKKSMHSTNGLLPRHREMLKASGLSDETIAAAGLYSVTGAGEAAKALNWDSFPPGMLPCLAIPFVGLEGDRVDGFTRLRPDSPRLNKQEKPCKYEQPGACPSALTSRPTAWRRCAHPAADH